MTLSDVETATLQEVEFCYGYLTESDPRWVRGLPQYKQSQRCEMTQAEVYQVTPIDHEKDVLCKK